MNKCKIFLILLCASFFAQAQTVDEVIENYIKAIGGREKIKGIQSAKTEIKMKAQMFEFPTVAYLKKDGSMPFVVGCLYRCEITYRKDGHEKQRYV